MERYTPQERGIIVSIFLRNNSSVVLAQREFRRRFPGRPSLTAQTMRRLATNLEEYGTTRDVAKSGRPRSASSFLGKKVSKNVLSCREEELKKKVSKNVLSCREEELKKGEVLDGQSPYFSPKKTRNIKIEYEPAKARRGTVKKPKAEVVDISPKVEIADEQTTKVSPKKRAKKDVKATKEEAHNDGETKAKIPKWEPQNWRTVLDSLRVMRKNTPAPVDTMGCTECSDPNSDEKTKRFHTLVALMLSSQTKDQTTFDAMNRLKANELTPKSIADIDETELGKILNPVSFYKNKAKYLKKTARILIDKYDSDIPNSVEDLVKLPGVGPKMAHICMSSAWNIVTGIGVDVHVHRISNRLHWLPKPTKEPEDTRKALEDWLPREYWSEVNHLLVGFGQTICTPVKPKCIECLNKDICPSAELTKQKKGKSQ